MRMGWFYGGVIFFFHFTVTYQGDVEAITYFETLHAVARTAGSLARKENKDAKQNHPSEFVSPCQKCTKLPLFIECLS